MGNMITVVRKESIIDTMTITYGILIMVLFAAGSLPGAVGPSAGRDTIVLQTVTPVDVPLVENGTMRQKIDLVFDRCPEEYWLYYNKLSERLIIEFFGVHVTMARKQIRGTPILSDLEVVNSETRFSLNGINARISMLMERGWHYKSWIIGEKVLRIQLWIPLDPQRTLQGNKKRSRLPAVIIIAALTCITAGVFLGLHASW